LGWIVSIYKYDYIFGRIAIAVYQQVPHVRNILVRSPQNLCRVIVTVVCIVLVLYTDE